jgi:hypothetical protein
MTNNGGGFCFTKFDKFCTDNGIEIQNKNTINPSSKWICEMNE